MRLWVSLNDEGKKVWGDVFPDGKVSVCTFFGNAELEGGGEEDVTLVNWKQLSYAQQDAILAKISARTGASKKMILKDILTIGLPLRRRYTTGVVAAELRFFI